MSNDGQVEVDVGTGNIFIDTSVVTTGEGSSQNRQRVAIGDAVQGEQFLSIGADGAASVHVINTVASVSVLNQSSGGNAASVSVLNLPAVQPVSQSGAWAASVDGTVVATQGAAPWTVDAIQQGNWGASISNVVPVSQSGAWTVNAQQQGNYGASISNQPTVLQGNAPWSVTASQSGNWGASVNNFPASQVISGSVSSIQTGPWSVNQGGPPWTVAGSVSVVQAGAWSANVTGSSVTAIPTGTQVVSGSVQSLSSSADIGYVGTWLTGAPSTGQATASVRAIQMTSTSAIPINGIIVGGISSNVFSVWAGTSGVASVGATGGAEIRPGSIIPFTCSNVNQIYILGGNNTDAVWWSVL